MRSLLALLVGGVVAVVLAYLATVVIDHTKIPDWLDLVAWLVALVVWLIWAFPAYTSARVT
jgi:hypothetical protein